MGNRNSGNLGQRLQAMPKPILYLLLILVCTIPQFFTIAFPNVPDDSSVELYAKLATLPEGSRVLLGTDWTGSTRGESKGQFVAIVKILMERKIKIAMYSTADPQAPQAAIDTISQINAERQADGKPVYNRWTDWVNVGFFADSEAANTGFANNFRATLAPKTDFPPTGNPAPVLTSPVFQGVTRAEDFQALILITASKTSEITIGRLGKRVPLAFAVTGVMGPETKNFYQSRQIVGLAVGLKGVYDLEQLIQHGVNTGAPGAIVSDAVRGPVPAVIPDIKPGQGTRFYPTLHFALFLMIAMIVLGNVGMFLAKRGTGGAR